MPRTRPVRHFTAAAGLCAALVAGCRANAAATITIEEIRVGPPMPARDSLCQLIVRVRNHGTAPASRFRFLVTLNGKKVDVYEDAVFFAVVPPGESTDIRLFNFWTTETSRPVSSRNELQIDVALREAAWTSRAADPDGVEAWGLREDPHRPTSARRAVIPLKPGPV